MSIATDIKWCVDNINSCVNSEHTASAKQLVINLTKKHKHVDPYVVSDLNELLLAKKVIVGLPTEYE